MKSKGFTQESFEKFVRLKQKTNVYFLKHTRRSFSGLFLLKVSGVPPHKVAEFPFKVLKC